MQVHLRFSLFLNLTAESFVVNNYDLTALAGRSVVASAPALVAVDREFESPRPDRKIKLETNQGES